LVLVDKKILFGGIAMLVVGLGITIFLNSIQPVGTSGMTEEETFELLLKQQENQDVQTLSGILSGVGFLLILISFGARRKRSGGAKKTEKKPSV